MVLKLGLVSWIRVHVERHQPVSATYVIWSVPAVVYAMVSFLL
jgi:hypothetical protein